MSELTSRGSKKKIPLKRRSSCGDCKIDLGGECYRCLMYRLARENIKRGKGSQADHDTIADLAERGRS